MPEPMPRGTPMTLATARMIPVPTMALAMPPPTSPGGLGVCVRNAQLTEPIPLMTRYAKMASSGTSTRMAAATANVVAPALVTRRTKPTCCGVDCADISGTHPRSPAGDAPHQQPGQCVDDEGHDKQRQPDLDQRAQVQIAGGLGEFVGDDTGHGVARREQRLRDLGTVADHHGNGHGFAQCAP